MIPVYFGKKFNVWAEGFIWQPIACEHCHLEWAFRVRIGGLGKGHSPYMLDNEGAKQRAAKQARLSLEEDRQLASEGVKRNVACPGCGHYQSEMVESLRTNHASSWAAIGVASILFGCLLVLRGLTVNGLIAGEAVMWLACGAGLIGGGRCFPHMAKTAAAPLRSERNSCGGYLSIALSAAGGGSAAQ